MKNTWIFLAFIVGGALLFFMFESMRLHDTAYLLSENTNRQLSVYEQLKIKGDPSGAIPVFIDQLQLNGVRAHYLTDRLFLSDSARSRLLVTLDRFRKIFQKFESKTFWEEGSHNLTKDELILPIDSDLNKIYKELMLVR